jgi:hypothetical protein
MMDEAGLLRLAKTLCIKTANSNQHTAKAFTDTTVYEESGHLKEHELPASIYILENLILCSNLYVQYITNY